MILVQIAIVRFITANGSDESRLWNEIALSAHGTSSHVTQLLRQKLYLMI